MASTRIAGKKPEVCSRRNQQSAAKSQAQSNELQQALSMSKRLRGMEKCGKLVRRSGSFRGVIG